MTFITLSLKNFTDSISDRDLGKLFADNPEARLEKNTCVKLIVISPTGSFTGEKNSDLNYQIPSWNRQSQLGKVFDSSSGFKLSNGAVRSPDVSWIEISRWNSLSREQQRKFAPIDPDFVIELMSPTDTLEDLQQKMDEYMSCGVKLGWLINPDSKEVEIYRVGQEKEVLNNPSSSSGEDVLLGLVVTLAEIYE